MVEALTQIGKLLELPNLEEETVKEINNGIRKMVNVVVMSYAANALDSLGEESGKIVGSAIDPFKAVQNAQQQAKELLGANTMNEWINGPEKT